MRAKFPVTERQISDVVAAFYTRARAHPVLGPVFAAHVTDWAGHEAKITRFWSNAILLDGSYSGNPMQVHTRASDVESDHFAAWLALFDEVLHDKIPYPMSAQWSHLAHRIGKGLMYGLNEARRPADAVPSFRTITVSSE